MRATRLNQAVKAGLRRAPVTLRRLAGNVNVSGSLLAKIRRGKRAATPIVAGRIADALEDVSRDTLAAARTIRKALRQVSR